MKREHLSDETIDGLEFEMRLASNPNLIAARDDYHRRRREFSKATIGKTKDEMIAELKAANPAYLVELLAQNSRADIHDRYVSTFMPRRNQ